MQPIMFIRHAEKPEKSEKGVTPDGEHDEHSLSVRGWTRAGALAALFANTRAPLTRPGRVIATAPSHSYKSKREHDTALPTADRLGVTIEAQAVPETYTELAEQLGDASDATLVVWHHGSIPTFVHAFPLVNPADVPQRWPEDRFDLIWLLVPTEHGYQWREVEQDLLHGDAPHRATP